MKKIALVFSLFVISWCASAQSDYKPFKVDVSLGYAIPGGSGAKGGVLFAVEPKYAVIDNLSIGLRLEAAVVARFSGYDSNGDPSDVSVKASGSYLATADYYFTDDHAVRPFVGAGAGLFVLAAAESNSNNNGISSDSKFGGMVRAGVELGHFRVGLEYNIVPKTTFSGFDNQGNPADNLISKNGYIGIKVGVCIGGGSKK